jgi:hypothetical protein
VSAPRRPALRFARGRYRRRRAESTVTCPSGRCSFDSAVRALEYLSRCEALDGELPTFGLCVHFASAAREDGVYPHSCIPPSLTNHLAHTAERVDSPPARSRTLVKPQASWLPRCSRSLGLVRELGLEISFVHVSAVGRRCPRMTISSTASCSLQAAARADHATDLGRPRLGLRRDAHLRPTSLAADPKGTLRRALARGLLAPVHGRPLAFEVLPEQSA